MSTDAMIGFVKDLQAHPTEIEALSFEYAWLESPLDAKLAWTVEVPDWRKISTWPAGRLFGEKGEYQWQRDSNNKLHCVLLLEKQPLVAELKEIVSLKCEGEEAYLLWGDLEANPENEMRFYAPEIPRPQVYPFTDQDNSAGKSPYLVVRRYSGLNDEGEFLRCAGLMLKTAEKEV